eukprot:3566145-Rhodomonas_salina.1
MRAADVEAGLMCAMRGARGYGGGGAQSCALVRRAAGLTWRAVACESEARCEPVWDQEALSERAYQAAPANGALAYPAQPLNLCCCIVSGPITHCIAVRLPATPNRSGLACGVKERGGAGADYSAQLFDSLIAEKRAVEEDLDK